MKALPMLDHVMLWVAWGFAFVCFAEVAFLVSRLTEQNIHLSRVIAMSHRTEFSTPAEYLTPILLVLATLSWNVGLWTLGSFGVRTYLILSAASMLIFIMCTAFFDPRSIVTPFNAASFILFFSIIWTGLRAPGYPFLHLPAIELSSHSV